MKSSTFSQKMGKSKKGKTVMVFGCFDILHKGHLNFLEQAKHRGDYLMVVVGRDKTIKLVKGRKPFFSESQRKRQLKKIPVVDRVLLGSKHDKYAVIEKHKPHIICLGYDQKFFTENLEKKLRKRNVQARIFRMKPYRKNIYKSSKIRKKLMKTQ